MNAVQREVNSSKGGAILDEHADLFRDLVKAFPDGIVISRDFRAIFVNPAAVDLFGASHPDQILGRPVPDLFHAEHREAVANAIERSLGGEPVLKEHARIVGFGSAVRDVEISSTVLGNPAVSVALIVHDVTERSGADLALQEREERLRTESALRESEERLRLAFAGAQEGVWDWSLETNAVVYSSRWKQMLGYADEEIEPNVTAWERLVHPEDRASADRANESVARGQPTYEAEFRLRHKDGHYVQVLSRGFPVRREPGGPVVRIVGTHFDLTERQKSEAERVRTELLTRLVFAQEDERRRIARDMHDQFGEHLTALGLRIGALKAMCADNTQLTREIDALDAIARSLDQDADRLAWELRPTALDDLGLRAALTNYTQDWSARVGIPARLHTSGLLDERLAPDLETTLYRIAQEALNNAAKYLRARHVEVLLERHSDSVSLVVEDDGIGFDADGGATGRGFGLVGMQERAALVGGTLEIESSPGKGTTVIARIAVPAGASSAVRRG